MAPYPRTARACSRVSVRRHAHAAQRSTRSVSVCGGRGTAVTRAVYAAYGGGGAANASVDGAPDAAGGRSASIAGTRWRQRDRCHPTSSSCFRLDPLLPAPRAPLASGRGAAPHKPAPVTVRASASGVEPTAADNDEEAWTVTGVGSLPYPYHTTRTYCTLAHPPHTHPLFFATAGSRLRAGPMVSASSWSFKPSAPRSHWH